MFLQDLINKSRKMEDDRQIRLGDQNVTLLLTPFPTHTRLAASHLACLTVIMMPNLCNYAVTPSPLTTLGAMQDYILHTLHAWC